MVALPVHAAASRKSAASVATKVFVAATLSSGPALMGSTKSHPAANGLAVSFTIAAVSAPALFAAAALSMRSPLCPDCEIARKSWSLRRSSRPYTLAMFGAAAATGMPR